MELDFPWLMIALAIFIGSSIFLFGFLRNLNDLYYALKLGKKRYSLPPGDMGWPLVGNMWSYYKAFKSKEPESFIFDLFERYGRKGIYRNHLFFSPSVLIVAPEACRQVFLDDANFKLGYPPSTHKLTFRGSFTSSKEGQKRIHKLATGPLRGHKAVAVYIGNIEEVVIKSLNEMSSMKRPIEFLTEMRKATFQVIAHVFLGSRSDVVIGSVEKYYYDYAEGLTTLLAINLPGFAFHKAMKARDALGEILQPILKETRAMEESDQRKGSKGLIDLLAQVKDENGENLEDVDIMDMLIAFLSAGHESSAHIATWAIILLHQHPKMLQKAKEEQEEIMKSRPSTQKGLTIEEIKRMEYAAKVIDETLRLINLTSSSFREAEADVNIQGYVIPKGWKVLLYNRGVHNNPDIYPIPKEFDPSRWDNRATKPGAFIPFGGGSRLCPGADLAKLEISIFIHYFLLNYKLKQLNPGCQIEYLPVPRPSDQCLARVVKLK